MDELDKVGNDILRDRILDLNNEQLKIVSHMAKDYFIMEYLDLGKLEKDEFLIKDLDSSSEKKRLLDIYHHLLNSFLKIVDEKNFSKEDILILREEIYDYSEVLSAYYIELKYMKSKIDEIILSDREKHLQVGPALDRRKDKLIDDIEKELLSLVDSPMDYINFMATVVNIIPFKLSKYKYYDLVEESLMTNLKDYSTEHTLYQIQEYKKQFNPKLNKGYGLYFDEYFTEIELLKRVDLEEKSINELKELVRKANILLENIGYNMMNIRRIGILTNRVLTIGMIIEEYDIDFDREILDKFLNKDRDIDNLVRLKFRDREEELFKTVDEFQAYNEELFKRKDYKYDLDEEFDRARKILVYYNDLEFTSNEVLNISDGVKQIDKEYLEQLIDNFIDFIKRNVKELEVAEGRIRMKSLLTVFTPSFKNAKEFIDYVKYSLDARIISDRELNLVLMSLNYIMDKRKEKES